MGLVSTDDFLPIAGAAVGIPSTGDETSTDEMGAFALGPLVPGDYTVIAQRLGFDPMAKKVTVYPGKETELAFVLETQPAPGPYHVTDPQVVLVEAFSGNSHLNASTRP